MMIAREINGCEDKLVNILPQYQQPVRIELEENEKENSKCPQR